MSELHPGGAEPAGVSHDLCVCGKPAAHVNADPDEADWACRVPVVGVSDAPENPELSIPAGVCDEAVEALARVLFDREWVPGDWRWEQYPQPNRWQELARKGLEASAPLLGTRPQPTLDRNRLFNILVEFIMAQPQRADVVEYDGVLDQIMALAVRSLPTLDRLAVHEAIADELDGEGVVSYGLAPKLTDRVMDVVRPLPTGEQIAEALHHDNHVLGSARCKQYLNGQLTSCYERTMHDADAVLALMGGAE